MEEDLVPQQPQYVEQLKTLIKVKACTNKWHEISKRWTRKAKDRYYRLRELTETEATYSTVLKTIHEKIELPLKQCGAISEDETRQMFPNIEGMIQLSNQIYTDLSQIFSSWNRHTTMIGQTMIRYSRFMLVYSDFFKNYNNTERKLKLLVENNQQVQQIQKQIAEPPKRQYFLDLYSKPFQRALKYHLILKDYFKQLHPDHPDYKHVEEALECYHKVNERNNEAINHNQRNQKLIQLDKVFSGIITATARYFVAQSTAMILDRKVKCYILSDEVLISELDGVNERQFLRIKINYESFVSKIKDGINFKNRLFFCGQKISIHLCFKEVEERDRFATYLSGIIQQIYNNYNYKEEIRQTRRATVSARMESARYSQAYRDTTNDLYSSAYESREYHRKLEEEPSIEETKQLLKEYAIDRDSFKLQAQMQKMTIGDRMKSTNGRSTAAESMEANIQYNTEERQGSVIPVNRLSITNTTAQLPRPPRIVVEGPIKRSYSANFEKIYYLTRIQLPFPSDRHQILYIPQEDMRIIQKISRIVYYQYRDYVDAPLFEELLKMMQCGQEILSQEVKCIYFTLILNSIFRHPQISKRLDIFAHKMGITEGFWLALRFPNIQCQCHYCINGAIVTNFQKYYKQLAQRNDYKRNLPKTFYCPFRTFHVQDAVLAIPPEQIQLSVDRLFRVRCEKGYMEYRLLDNAPLDQSPPKFVIFNIAYGLMPIKHEKFIHKQERVGQIKHGLVKDLGIDLSEYQICIEIGSQNYILGDDQILYNILENEQEPEKGITGFFKNTFGSSQDTTIKVIVKRIWWFLQRQLDTVYLQKNELKLDFLIESLANRIKNQEIQLNVKDTLTFYACYLIYRGQKNVTQPILQCLVPVKKWKNMSSSVRNEMLKNVQQFHEKYINSFQFSEGANLKRQIFSYFMKVFKDRKIWGVFLYEGLTNLDGKQKPVRIGFDLQHFIIKQPEKVTNVYEQALCDIMPKIVVSSWELRVKDKTEKQIRVTGTQFEQMMKLLELYVHFAKTFKDIK